MIPWDKLAILMTRNDAEDYVFSRLCLLRLVYPKLSCRGQVCRFRELPVLLCLVLKG